MRSLHLYIEKCNGDRLSDELKGAMQGVVLGVTVHGGPEVEVHLSDKATAEHEEKIRMIATMHDASQLSKDQALEKTENDLLRAFMNAPASHQTTQVIQIMLRRLGWAQEPV